jgi:hypothetical protein
MGRHVCERIQVDPERSAGTRVNFRIVRED